jgi:serine/threonine-protein kinase HipA
MIMISKTIVFVYLPGELEAVPAGELTLNEIGGEVNSVFVYGKRYVQRPNAISLDPVSLDIRQVAGQHNIQPKNNLSLFGAFRDAAPDSFGRRVLEKERNVVSLPEIEYLINAWDDRVGALDFREGPTSEAKKHPYNQIINLKYLLDCANKIENNEPVAANMLRLFQYGSHMGGARPKAIVEDDEGLWLAKFNSRGDHFTYSNVEKATLTMAKACGLNIPDVKVVDIGTDSVFMIKRFDREKLGKGYSRKHFVSALTMLGKDEMESPKSSYAEICQAISKYCIASEVKNMQVELFKRMVMNILVSNLDDHLRNHGFLYEQNGYVLSPAYDIVPTPQVGFERYQHLGVGSQGRLSTLDNALSSHHVFGLSENDAVSIIKQMCKIVLGWREFYSKEGVSDREISILESAFRAPKDIGLDYVG